MPERVRRIDLKRHIDLKPGESAEIEVQIPHWLALALGSGVKLEMVPSATMKLGPQRYETLYTALLNDNPAGDLSMIWEASAPGYWERLKAFLLRRPPEEPLPPDVVFSGVEWRTRSDAEE